MTKNQAIATVIIGVTAIFALFFYTTEYLQANEAYQSGQWRAGMECDFPSENKREIAEDIMNDYWYLKQPEEYMKGFHEFDCELHKQHQAAQLERHNQVVAGLAVNL